MDFKEAFDLYEGFLRNEDNSTDDEFFLFTEAAELLYKHTGEPGYMMTLAGVYYGRKEYELAQKYYEIAAEQGDDYSNIGLGYIWYYGRTGEIDYKKAFEYFSRCKGDINAEYKLADMYRTGKYVDKDQKKYEEKIEEIYELLQYSENKHYVPEIYSRLARIRMSQGRDKEAFALLCGARKSLAKRLRHDSFFGNFTIMKGIIEDLHKNKYYTEGHPEYDIFDLYVLFEKPCSAELTLYGDNTHIKANAVEEDGAIVVECGGKWYRSAAEFIQKNSDFLTGKEPPRVKIADGSV
ncbi:MAG: hypothetical protein K6C13_11060 [Oscillospiraceae bacterium]|nr:hypothetical protein [Oscillospiraceae bacterium]